MMKKGYAIPPLVFQWFIRLCTLLVFKSLTKLEVKGIENLSTHRGSLIFASNHTSEWDGPLIRSVLPMFSRFGPMFYVSREKSFYTRSGWRKLIYGGFLFRLLGAYSVSVGHRDYEVSLANHIKILEDGFSVNIFPEGKRTMDGTLGEGRGGAVYLSLRTRTPIVPVGITGLFKFGDCSLFYEKRRVAVSFGIPYMPTITDKDNETTLNLYKIETAILMRKISDLL